MAFFRRFFSFMNNNNNKSPNIECDDPDQITIATYYLGQTFAADPNSDELRRAAHILLSKTKKDLEKNLIPIVYICFENTAVLLRDGKNHKCREYDVRRIVMSCIDAKNQKLVAIFYHNESPYIGNPKSNMLECHLCLCKNKESAKTAANQIGLLLSREYKIPSRHPIKKMQDGSVRLSKANYDDFDYENVSKFFQQKVFGLPVKEGSASSLSTPCSSVSTFATTTGCDSGCASTIASVDLRTDDSINGIREPTINEHEEFHSSFEDSLSNHVEIDSSSSQNIHNDIGREGSRLSNHENCNVTTTTKNKKKSSATIQDKSIYHNRYSVHYDLEDESDGEETGDESKKPLTSALNDKDVDEGRSSSSVGLRTPELQRLLDLGETSI
uniref:PID domain-containing protein n=1 Tax=Clytia hemisphaerica TaxID=252671 RepID=A0A7M5VGE7_9CNID|eukprot:TCONS_00011424-protein